MHFITIVLVAFILTSCGSAPRSQLPQLRFPTSFEQYSQSDSSWKIAEPSDKQFMADDLYLKASNAMLHNQYQEADQYWKSLVQLKPDDRYVRRQYGVNLIALGKLEEARTVFSFLYNDSKKEDYTLGLVLAGIYAADSKDSESEAIYRDILKRKPGHEEACVYLSRSLTVKKQYQTAHQLLSQCEKDNRLAVFPYYRGKIEIERKREALAVDHFLRSIKIDASYHQAVMGLGLIYETQGHQSKALEVYRRYLDHYGDNYSILSRIVYIYANGNDREKLVSAMEQLSTLDPTDINLKVRLGVAYTDLQRIDDAVAVFKEILEEVPASDKILYYLGALLVQKNSYEEAIAYFDRITSDSVLFQESRVQVARVLSAMAAAEFKEGSERGQQRFFTFVDNNSKQHPAFAASLAVIAASYYDDTGRVSEAIHVLTPYIDSELLASEDKYFLALLFEKNGQRDQCISLLRQVVAKDPDNADVLNFLGYTLLEKGGDLTEAYTHISRAVALKPEDGYIRDSLGWYYYLIGNYQQATIELQQAWQLVQNDSTVAKHLAMAHEKMGNMKKADFFLKQAIVFCKEESEKQYLIQTLEQLQQSRLPASK